MSPRASSAATSPARSASTPYSRRPSSQPKSSRQQFSACGACRMRRVRCDLKDLPIGSAGPHPTCSNCKERGINCIDEFADVKAVKLLRRGRRLQQVEAIYGKIGGEDGNTSPGGSSRITTSIPILHIDFFSSPFWRWFVVQRPILDGTEFPTRFAAHSKGTQPLGNEGDLISMILVTYAASFGLDERGVPAVAKPTTQPALFSDEVHRYSHPYTPPGNKRMQWKNVAEMYLREIFEVLDYHGVLRRPTLDGLRALLLLLPLLDEAQPLERVAIHEAALSQVHALCVLSPSSPSTFEDAAIRARIFWYAYIQEGLITGIRGSRFVLTSDDLEAFQRTLPSLNFGAGSTGLPTPPLSSARELAAHKAYIQLMHTSSTPLELSKVCRKIHQVLTGIKATRTAEDHGLVDAIGMREIWGDLDRCWQELESMKSTSGNREGQSRSVELREFVHGWQIFIFECHNVIREALKHYSGRSNSHSSYADKSSPRPSSSSPYMTPQHLHTASTHRCIALLPRIVRILRAHTTRERTDIAGILSWDAGLVRDGCFFAGYLAASVDRDILDTPSEDNQNDDDKVPLTVNEAVSVCLDALATVRWGYSKSDEREETIRLVWESRKSKHYGHSQTQNNALYDVEYPPVASFNVSPNPLNPANNHFGPGPTLLPPLVSMPLRRAESAPSTSSSTDGRGLNGWPSYTPPGTGTSNATSNGTGLSSCGDSPVFANMPPFKSPTEEMFYNSSGNEIEQFSYNVPLAGSVDRDHATMASNVSRYSQRPSPPTSHPLANSTTVNYVASNFHTPSTSLLTDFQSHPQFGENSAGTYH